MKRALGVSTVALAITLTLLVAQTSSKVGQPLPQLVGKVITIRQGSRPGEKFVTLRAWERPDKTVIRYIRSEETGELATLVETPGQSQAQLYRWGPGRTQPPPGVPTIPDAPGEQPSVLPEAVTSQRPEANPPASTPWKPTQDCQSTPTPPISPSREAAEPGLLPGPIISTTKPASLTGVRQDTNTTKFSTITDSSAAATAANIAPHALPQSTGPTPLGTAWLQQLGVRDRPGDVISLHFPDKGVQTCTIVSKQTASDGTVWLTVRSEATGEIMTVTTAQVNAPVATLIPAPLPTTSVGPLVEPQMAPREGLWSRLAYRLGLRRSQSAPVVSSISGEGIVPPLAIAPPPRESAVPATAETSQFNETRIIVGPVPVPSNAKPDPDARNLGSASVTSVATSSTAPVQQFGTSAPQQATSTAERRGLFNRLFGRDANRPAAPDNSRLVKPGTTGLSREEIASVQHEITSRFHAAAFQPPARVTVPVLEPPVPFPPAVASKPNDTTLRAPSPDPLREPEKYVKRNPVREEVTNAGLVASPSQARPTVPPVTSGAEAKPSAGAQPPSKPTAATSSSVAAPVPMPLVPLVTDKPRPDVPPPQPPIQPFSTMQVAAVQNPHQFPHIVPPVVPSQPYAPATPVAWTRGPMLPPHQSPVSALAMQATGNATEAMAVRNTLFLTNVLQASGSPQQREWAAARLAVIEANRYPFAVEALVQAAKHDPHPAVRIKAIQSLALMRADSPDVRQALQVALRDPDPRIREQASYAMQLINKPEDGIVPAHHVPAQR